jgi:hypothetical protein
MTYQGSKERDVTDISYELFSLKIRRKLKEWVIWDLLCNCLHSRELRIREFVGELEMYCKFPE